MVPYTTFVERFASQLSTPEAHRSLSLSHAHNLAFVFFHIIPYLTSFVIPYLFSERPELNNALYEIIAPAEYTRRPPPPPAFLFVIDVSRAAASSGMLASLSRSVLASLDMLPGDVRTQVGFITFDSTVHFYQMKPTSAGPRMLVVPEVESVFLPAPDDLLVNLRENRTQIEQFLNGLPTVFANTKNVETAFGAAIDGTLFCFLILCSCLC